MSELDKAKSVEEFFDLIEAKTVSLIKTAKRNIVEENVFNKNSDSSKEKKKDDDKIMQLSDVSVDDIIKKVNYIRSGKSLNTKNIKNSFKKYFASLTPAERVALFASLKGIGQIITGEIIGSDALTPKEPPSNVVMKKVKDAEAAEEESDKEVYRVDTKIVKSEEDEEEKEETEDIEPPVKAKQ